MGWERERLPERGLVARSHVGNLKGAEQGGGERRPRRGVEPGGKREPNETVRECLVREVMEELAMAVQPVVALSPVEHDYPRGPIRLHPYVCYVGSEEPQLLACQAVKWVNPLELKRHQFPPANEPLIEEALASVNSPVKRARYAGRSASASPATGLMKRHQAEQGALVADALGHSVRDEIRRTRAS